MDLTSLFGQIARTVGNHASANTPGPSYDSGGLLGSLAGIFGQQAQQSGQQFDPGQHGNYNGYDYNNNGIPDNQEGGGGNFGNVLPASQDPYGDPANQAGGGQFGNVLPASQDPYGDPADGR
ncbi:MAG TPA: hypothetical protein VF681_12795 [Abditibacteriaceae bacterium]|jgi:hypothetical protein